jgi:hypothetical protein
VVALTNETMRPPTAARRRLCQELVRGAGTGIISLDGKVLPVLGQDAAGSPSSLGTA